MDMDIIQIILLLWIIERISIERSRYKIGIDSDFSSGYWSIWVYHKPINSHEWMKAGGKRIIHFKSYFIPKLG